MSSASGAEALAAVSGWEWDCQARGRCQHRTAVRFAEQKTKERKRTRGVIHNGIALASLESALLVLHSTSDCCQTGEARRCSNSNPVNQQRELQPNDTGLQHLLDQERCLSQLQPTSVQCGWPGGHPLLQGAGSCEQSFIEPLCPLPALGHQTKAAAPKAI